MTLFFIGIVEMLIVTFWTKAVTETKVVTSGVITMINVLIWYYVLQKMMDDISNWRVAALYALGCSIGTVLTTYFFRATKSKNTEAAACASCDQLNIKA